jgi:transcriptional regulator of acetoin/glycerol metabolism
LKVDLRVVAATNAPLDRLVLRGQFRGDLLARLSGYRHELAPLRCRIEDTGLLIAELLARSGPPSARELRISPAAGRRLLRHDWPLNIRELEQIIAVAAALSDGGVIEPAHLPEAPLSTRPARSTATSASHDPEELRRRIVALRAARGKVTHVARDMGKARMQIHR